MIMNTMWVKQMYIKIPLVYPSLIFLQENFHKIDMFHKDNDNPQLPNKI